MLLGHPGGPFWKGQDHGIWSVPKGVAEPGEAPESVAAREFAEETGFELASVARDPASPPMDLGEAILKSGKVIHAWAVEGDLDPALAASNEIEIEWPPRSGRRLVIPEVDRVEWFGPDEARRRAHPAQAAFVDRLERMLGRERDSARPAAVARRFLVLRHLLAPPRALPAEPESVLRVIDRIGSLQFDPLEVAGRNHDLVLLARIAGYRREWTDHWLYEDRRLYETYNKSLNIVPVAELPLYRWIWDRARRPAHGRGVRRARAARRGAARADPRAGPASPRDVGAREAIDWYWRPTNQVRAILEALAEAGTSASPAARATSVSTTSRSASSRPTILAERRPEDEQQRHRLLSRYRANGLLGASGNQELWVGGTGYAADRAARRRCPRRGGAAAPRAGRRAQGRAVRRRRGSRCLDAAPSAEIRDGTPPGGAEPAWRSWPRSTRCAGTAICCGGCSISTTCGRSTSRLPKRRWGYYVLPILYGDRIVGRIEPRIDRRAGDAAHRRLLVGARVRPARRARLHGRHGGGARSRTARSGPPIDRVPADRPASAVGDRDARRAGDRLGSGRQTSRCGTM